MSVMSAAQAHPFTPPARGGGLETERVESEPEVVEG